MVGLDRHIHLDGLLMNNSGEVQWVERPMLCLRHFAGGVVRVPPDTDKVFGVLMSNSGEVDWVERPLLYPCHFAGGALRVPFEWDKVLPEVTAAILSGWDWPWS